MKISFNTITVTNSILKGVTLPEKPECNCDEVDGAGDFEGTHIKCQERLNKWTEAYNSALEKGIEFESQEKTLRLLPLHAVAIIISPKEYQTIDGIYPLVEPIECEVQRQWRNKGDKSEYAWKVSIDENTFEYLDYRTVLVICEVKEERNKCDGKKNCDCAAKAMAEGANRDWVDGVQERCKFPSENRKIEVKEQPIHPLQEMIEGQQNLSPEIHQKVGEKFMDLVGEVSKPEREEWLTKAHEEAKAEMPERKKLAEILSGIVTASPDGFVIPSDVIDKLLIWKNVGLKEDTQTNDNQEEIWKEFVDECIVGGALYQHGLDIAKSKFTISRKQ